MRVVRKKKAKKISDDEKVLLNDGSQRQKKIGRKWSKMVKNGRNVKITSIEFGGTPSIYLVNDFRFFTSQHNLVRLSSHLSILHNFANFHCLFLHSICLLCLIFSPLLLALCLCQ